MLLHILMFDKAYNLTYWVNYTELKAQLRRRYDLPQGELTRYHTGAQPSVLNWRLASLGQTTAQTRSFILREAAPHLTDTGVVTSFLSSPKTFTGLTSSFVS